MSIEQAQARRIAELEAENARLRFVLDAVKEDRRQLWDREKATYPPTKEITAADYDEMMRNHVPGSSERFLEELGLLPGKSE